MIRILMLLAGTRQMFPESDYPYPVPLIEVGRVSIIERVINNLNSVSDRAQFTFVVNQTDCRRYHLDSTLNILTDQKCDIVRLSNPTRGAACSALMAINYINDDEPLIIANPDQIFDDPLSTVVESFGLADAGVAIFDSVHPRWSYVRLNPLGDVQETAEKRPISRNAVAGLYYFRRGADFINAAMSMIRKDASIDGVFYIAPTLNELVLEGKTVRAFKIDGERYHSFYTPQRIQEYERLLLNQQVVEGGSAR